MSAPEKEIGGDLTHHLFSAPFQTRGWIYLVHTPQFKVTWISQFLEQLGGHILNPKRGMHKMTLEGFWMSFGCHFKMKKNKHRILNAWYNAIIYDWNVCNGSVCFKCFETTRIQFGKFLSLKTPLEFPSWTTVLNFPNVEAEASPPSGWIWSPKCPSNAWSFQSSVPLRPQGLLF